MVQSIQPHRYLIYQANDIVKALNERLNVPRKQIYAIMPIQKTGIALENKPLPQLPTSKMMLLTSKARPMETTRFNEFQTQTQTLNYTLMGSQNLEFTVRKP